MATRATIRTGLAIGLMAALVGAGTADAVDGVIEINDAAVVAAGGYPFAIAATGSYVLTGNLTPPPATSALTVAAPSVEIDLNGFSLIGAGGGGAAGLASAGAVGTTVKNGSITGFGGAGITAALELKVFKTRISGNGAGILGAGQCLVVESTIVGNTGVGIDGFNCKIENNVISGNDDTGIGGMEHVIVHNKIADNGFAVGGGGILSFGGSTIHENVIIRNFGFGISDTAGAPPGPVPAPPGIPFPGPPPPAAAPNNITKNVVDGGGGISPGIGIYMGGSALIGENSVVGWGGDGIVCSTSCTLRGNQVHSNNVGLVGNGGVTAGPGSTVNDNSISFNTGVGLVLDPTAVWTNNSLSANTAQDMTVALPIGPAAAAPHPSSGFMNLCSGVPGPVAGFGPGSCP